MIALKDETLWKLSVKYNVARFISFDDNLKLRYFRISRHEVTPPSDMVEAVQDLLSLCGSVNIRTFLPDRPSGNPFIYGLMDSDAVINHIRDFAKMGYFCLVNETISVTDGGISGVVDSGIVEFSPDDTPRAVEKPGICSLPLTVASHILTKVYGVANPIPVTEGQRVEFSLHPTRVGIQEEHTLVWESSPSNSVDDHEVVPYWPNNFSRHIGDKVFGLLVADAYGLPVPRGTVVGRRVAPFIFGHPTSTNETWIRTCPITQEPGKYTTTKNWVDPYLLMSTEDPSGQHIQSIVFQDSIDAKFSGASIPSTTGNIIEGVTGNGAQFMAGTEAPEILPTHIYEDIGILIQRIRSAIGTNVRIEWVHDGSEVWLVQLHVYSTDRSLDLGYAETQTIYWLEYDPEKGLDELLNIINNAKTNGAGVKVLRSIGITSHIGDLLRKNSIPFKIITSALY